MKGKFERHFPNIFKIMKLDFKNATSNPLVTLAFIALIVVPSLYALLNIAACWDPYGNSSQLDFAIVNNDQYVEFNGENVSVGHEVVEALKNNTKFNWKFVSEANAREGVENGTYFAAMIFPSDFSKDIISVTTQHPKSAEMEYLINEKTNPVASRLSNSAAKEVQNKVSANIVEVIDVDAVEKLSILQASLASGSSQLNSGASQVSSGASKINSGASELVSKSSQVSAGASKINSGASKISEGAATIDSSAKALESSVDIESIPDPKLRYVVNSSINLAKSSGQLATSSSELAKGSSDLAGGSVKLVSGSNKLASGSVQVASGSSKLASSAAYGFVTAANSLEDITTVNENHLGDYLYSPVKLVKNSTHKVNDYGSEVAPFYLVLSIWVGCVITCALIKTRYLKSKFTPLEMYFGKMAMFIILVLLQTTVTIAGSFVLGIQVNNIPLFILGMYFIGLVFMTFVYSLVSVFGNVGKGLAVLILVLQISSTGGVYPVQLMAPFFQAISPFMPMTYAISMLREANLGVFWGNYISSFIVLLGLLIAVLILSIIIKEKYNERANYLEKVLIESNLFSL